MVRKRSETLDVRTRGKWRAWLEAHHDSTAEIWLVFHKRHTGIECLDYEAAVEEALCFGWVDSLVRRLDDARYARKFTPRKADSSWSSVNRRRYRKLEAEGRLSPAGVRRAPTERSGDPPAADASRLPAYIEQRLRRNMRAWRNFEKLAPSYRRAYVAWIDSAKRETTKQRRLSEAVRLLAAGKKLGMK